MENIVVWLIALGIGAVVAGATFLVASRLSRVAKPTSDDFVRSIPLRSEVAEKRIKRAEPSVSEHEPKETRNSKNSSLNLGGKTALIAVAVVLTAVVAVAAIVLYIVILRNLRENTVALDCASTQTQNSVLDIAKQNDNALLDDAWGYFYSRGNQGLFTELKRETKYTLNVIRTTHKDKETGNIECASGLRGDATLWGGVWHGDLPITYKVEWTSDGKSYVTVYGLKGH